MVPGDIMHDEVVLSYENYFNTAFRNLPKRVKAKMEEKYEVWQMVFDIVQVCVWSVSSIYRYFVGKFSTGEDYYN